MPTDTSDSRPIRASDSGGIGHQRPIRTSDSKTETDAFATRLRECIGDEPVASFARRCGIPEANLRNYLTGTNKPVYDRLAAIAEVAGVTLDWLATGRGPKRRADAQVPVTPDISASPYARRWEKIMALVEGIEDEEERSAFLDELFARARQTAELAELRQAVKTLTATLKKTT